MDCRFDFAASLIKHMTEERSWLDLQVETLISQIPDSEMTSYARLENPLLERERSSSHQ
jgi:hypothetical protein